MENTRDVEKLISSLKNADLSGKNPLCNARTTSVALSILLTSENGVSQLKQHPKNLEVVLPLFFRIIFHPDPDVSKPALKLCDVVFEIFRSKCPKIKKEQWWIRFELNPLLDLVDSLKGRIEACDNSWVTIWTFIANIVITETLNVKPLNKLLAVSQCAFQKGKESADIREKAWVCWRRLIDAFGRNPEILIISKTINLLKKPLLSLSHMTKAQISTWVHLIEVKGISGPSEVVKSIIETMCEAMYKSGDRSSCRTLADDCANALVQVLSHEHVRLNCLPDIIEVFGACVNSRPSAGLIEQLAGSLIRSINDLKDVDASYKLWKALIEQCNSCSESPFLSVAWQKIFADVNFIRWIDSGTVGGNEIALLMVRREFRSNVLLGSIKALTYVDQAETPTKKKNRKGSYEDVWSNYCEAYIAWLSNKSPPASPSESSNPVAIQSMKDSCDYQATQSLLLQPLQQNIWSGTMSKTWARLCEACYKQRFLQTFIKPIFDALDEPNFHLRQAIDVTDCLYKLDSDVCQHSAKLLGTISSFIFSMEFQNLLDVLNLSETAVQCPDMSSVLGKICKNANERSADYDQLNGHKIKTKVSKIARKLEQLSNSAEKEKPAKAQRTPFRTQSNFLQRLAKAEEKNKTRSPFFTSIFSNADKVKNGLEKDEDAQSDDAAVIETQENGVVNDDSKKPVNLDDSEFVPIITLPSVLKGSPALGNGHTEEIAAEKENVILSPMNGTNTAAIPTVASPKMKITNAREVKPVDASSPTVVKKGKPVVGQKSTPKKVTPSKVSYFDDDANDCIMVPPKPKTTPLTEHQMEMMSKRRTDIPALYQDLSQDTQSQQVVPIQEVTTGVSPRPIQESQDIVPRTPSPEDRIADSTPEPRKSAGKCTSAKKLDFNCLPSPSKNSLLNGSFRKMSPTPDENKSKGENSTKLASCLQLALCKESENMGPLNDDSRKHDTNSVESVGTKEDQQSISEEKSKRKRKSEPSKFSPKLTRSKKSLKSATPDAKLTKMPESKAQLRSNSPDPGVKFITPASSETPTESSQVVTNKTKIQDSQALNKENNCIDTPTNGPLDDSNVSSQLVEESVPSSQSKSEVPEPSSKEKPKKSRKRRIVESPSKETPKKAKTSGEESSSATKKCDSAKKKKKPFKLSAGGNLENWLVKTDRVPTPVPEPEMKCENGEPADEVTSEPEKSGSGALPNDPVVDLDNSEEIVPSTQEFLMENKPIPPALQSKMDENCLRKEVVDEMAKEELKAKVPEDADHRSPEKPEGSVLERLSHESPNDDDIALVISPSKRQRRAPSVFRGEGDTYLSNERLNSASSTEPEEDTKVSPRSKNKTTSPTSKKRLHPLGGRSAKMLRLATGTTTEDGDDGIVVTPVRRRESIAPVKYGENWPKGPVEDWVACTPASPYMSPFRSALKKTPGMDDNVTPQKGKNETMASPLLSSAKRKRVMFLDPPVTLGLAYNRDSPSGSVHHADVPQGSPYPTWKGDPKEERDAERLNSLGETLKEECAQEEALASKDHGETSLTDLKPYAAYDVSEELKQLICPAEPTSTIPSTKPDMRKLQEKFNLSDDFMTAFSETDAHLHSLLLQCFDCENMTETVDTWRFGDCRRICQMPQSFLRSVKNSSGEALIDTLTSSGLALLKYQTLKTSESSAQTEPPVTLESSSQTVKPLFLDSYSQTVAGESRSVETNTETPTSSSTTQTDKALPPVDEWPTLFENTSPKKALLYFSDSLRVLSTSLPNKK